MEAEIAPIRAGEELDLAALTDYLRGRIEGGGGALALEQFTGGRSNLTYLLTAAGKEYVLRRAPLGPLPPRAHDMVREYRLLERLRPHFPLVPKVHHLCEDPGVIGAPFYLMERHRGVVIRSVMPAELAGVPDVERRASEACVDCLASMHAVDIDATGLASIGKPQGFLERHLEGWIERWYQAQTEEVPGMDRVVAWMTARMPVSPRPALIHNDFRLDNVILDSRDPGTITAVLDWEMATVGDPLVDLGLTLCYWLERGELEDRRKPVFERPGWFSREEFLERYQQRTGFDLSAVAWYEVLGVFKLAVIVQQIYYRYFRGQTGDPRFRNYPLRVRALTQCALELAGL